MVHGEKKDFSREFELEAVKPVQAEGGDARGSTVEADWWRERRPPFPWRRLRLGLGIRATRLAVLGFAINRREAFLANLERPGRYSYEQC